MNLRSIAASLCLLSFCAMAAPPAVPPELEPWRQWALDGAEYRRCPMLAGSAGTNAESFLCAWPERLELDVSAGGAQFSQHWVVHTESWIELPGNAEHWPRDVTINGAPAAVVAHRESPHLRLAAGSYAIAGAFTWIRRPESLAVPDETALIDLVVDGQRIAQPERPGGSVWLGKRRTAQQQEQMEIQVYRRLEDQIPARLITRVRLQVAGDGREELLSRVLPEGFVALWLQSELPARIEPDGRLRVQVRAGSWDVQIAARGTDVAQAVRRPPVDGPWAKEEVWSFGADDRLRVVAVEGVSGVDPVQTAVPHDWRELPAYRMAPDSELRLIERSRGMSSADENQLSLRRRIWLDFDHEGYTVADRINGQMRQGWRLDMAHPQRLLSASSNGENLLVTLGAREGLTGIEVREPQLEVGGISRIEQGGALSATGWQGRFFDVNATLHLPPGHRLLAVVGADDAPTSWIRRWRLLDMFLVLIAAAAVAKLIGWPAGILALIAFVLTRHEAGNQIWLWINLLLAVVLAREAPAGWLRSTAVIWRNLAALALLIFLVPFVFLQARLAVYPELDQEPPALMADLAGQSDDVEMIVPAEAPAPPMAAAPAFEVPPQGMEERAREADSINVTGSRRSLQASSGLNYAQVLQRYAPGTLVQTGPGVPGWTYFTHPFRWSGPVDQDQTVRLIILTPAWHSLWRIVGCVLLAALLVLIAHATFARPALPPWATRYLRSAAPLLLLALLPLAELRAEAPRPEILNELRNRLTRAPDCAPSCGDVMHARVRAVGEQLDIVLRVSALAPIAVPIPAADGRWEPQDISIDGAANGGLYRDAEGTRWVALRAGAHEVRLTGRIADGDSVPLVFPMRPRTIEVSADGWEPSGVGDGRLLTNTLELVRKRSASGSERLETVREFPPFVRVHRHIVLDLDWSVATQVQRIAPEKGAFTLGVPLLNGESVLTEGIEVRDDRTALVAMPAGEVSVSWNSGLPRAEALELQFPKGVPRSEVWSFAVSPQWHVSFNGVPAVFPADPGAPQWTFEFHPRGDETLTVAVTRPNAAEGATLAIDGVDLSLQVGQRSANGTLNLQYRSTQGGRHTIRLPAEARVTAVHADNRPIAVRPENGELTVSLLPGAHALNVAWQIDEGTGLRTRAPAIDLRSPASNVATHMTMPENRWVLLAFGQGVGPVILLWSELAVFVVLAVLIGQSRHSPLRVHEWLLLGLGLSTYSWWVLLLFAAWLFAMRWREGAATASRAGFNLRQIALGVLSVAALGALVAAIPAGLLGTPDMHVAGHGSYAEQFAWFLDQSEGPLPRPGLISVSIWWYRAAMLAWALWLSFALLRWVPWAWRAWSRDGIWRRRDHVIGPPPPLFKPVEPSA